MNNFTIITKEAGNIKVTGEDKYSCRIDIQEEINGVINSESHYLQGIPVRTVYDNIDTLVNGREAIIQIIGGGNIKFEMIRKQRYFTINNKRYTVIGIN